jgi:hypothetical protein
MGEGKSRRLGRTGYFTAPFATDADKARWHEAIFGPDGCEGALS